LRLAAADTARSELFPVINLLCCPVQTVRDVQALCVVVCGAACNCNVLGSQRPDCEQMTGRCVCRPGVTGQKCNLCPNGKRLSPTGCTGPSARSSHFHVVTSVIRPHRSTMYVDAANCYRPSSVVCRSVGLSHPKTLQYNIALSMVYISMVTLVSPAKAAEPIEMPATVSVL